ncbi:prepilin peptidase [Patescibacteria group bacterium]|nr:prepilin peptidase [Patescibacteria group bacterium]MBU1721789.1 prepilin peptidase [Patescibacteria group bacterium]MBU1901372.1 prepilin peptidase [Patescibacteria group bacterium]
MISLFFIVGLLFGSFLNAWMWRVRTKKSIVFARSMCPKCTTQLACFDNIPLFSFLYLKGKCRTCKKAISLTYPLVELALGLLFVFVYWWHGTLSLVLFRDLCIVFFLLFIFVYDLRYQEIRDRASTIPAILLGLVTLIYGWHSLSSLLIAVVIGAGFFLLQFVVSKGKWIGGGDIRLGFFMGVILGWPNILLALVLAYIGGAAVSVVLLMMKKKELASETPFGTYLALATFVTMFWGEQILNWYLGMI